MELCEGSALPQFAGAAVSGEVARGTLEWSIYSAPSPLLRFPRGVSGTVVFQDLGNAMHAVRTQCKVLDVGQYSNPSFGPF